MRGELRFIQSLVDNEHYLPRSRPTPSGRCGSSCRRLFSLRDGLAPRQPPTLEVRFQLPGGAYALGAKTPNVDRFASQDTVYKREERRMALRTARVDIVASGDDLPFDDDSYDFVFSSHVVEHFPDPLKALYEWVRVARRYVVVIAPHRDRTFDAERPLSTVDELLERHRNGFESAEDQHWSVWTCESFIEMCQTAGLSVIDHQDPDDKVGNGFTVVIDPTASQLSLTVRDN